MALLDISRVTATLVRLLEEHIGASPAWPSATAITVTPEPPDKLSGDNALGLYLYHVTEESHFKNLATNGGTTAPVRYSPMGLALHYQLTAHSDIEGAAGAYQEQLMMGCAIKALHDYTVIDDSTQIDGVTIMDPTLLGEQNRLRITLNPVAPDAAVSYWTAGTSGVRLAGYYVASVVLIEPEESPTRAGRVLKYGAYAFPQVAPRLTASYNTLVFRIPGESEDTSFEARPAQVAPGDSVTFAGTSLVGDESALLVRFKDWDEAVEADASWNVTLTSGPREQTLVADVQETIGSEDILPGIYGASVRVVSDRTLADGSTRRFEHTSNETPFVVTPRLDPVPAPDSAGNTQITGYVFQHADLDPDDLSIFVGDERLVEGTSGALAQGEYAVVDASTVDIRLPAGLDSGAQAPVRVLKDGAESAPQWVQVP